MKKLETHRVPEGKIEVRLSDYTPGKFRTTTSKKGMKKAIEKGLVKVNGEVGRTADYIRGGEVIELFQENIGKQPWVNLDIEVAYEDDHIAIVNKPAGIVVSGNKRYTLENTLSKNLTESNEIDALQRAEPIHRLDHPTSGALLIGKTSSAVIELNKYFEEKKIDKTYFAVTMGKQKKSGTISDEIKGKSAETKFKVIETVPSEKYEFLNLVELKPSTGRRHQLRIHMAGLGNPILGDNQYGIEGKILKGKGLYLHSSKLEFDHPITKEKVSVEIPLPNKFLKIFPVKE